MHTLTPPSPPPGVRHGHSGPAYARQAHGVPKARLLARHLSRRVQARYSGTAGPGFAPGQRPYAPRNLWAGANAGSTTRCVSPDYHGHRVWSGADGPRNQRDGPPVEKGRPRKGPTQTRTVQMHGPRGKPARRSRHCFKSRRHREKEKSALPRSRQVAASLDRSRSPSGRAPLGPLCPAVPLAPLGTPQQPQASPFRLAVSYGSPVRSSQGGPKGFTLGAKCSLPARTAAAAERAGASMPPPAAPARGVPGLPADHTARLRRRWCVRPGAARAPPVRTYRAAATAATRQVLPGSAEGN